jgi:hypothetical protein
MSIEKCNFDETISSLRFGQRCGEIKVDIISDTKLSAQDQIFLLEDKVKSLQNQLARAEEKFSILNNNLQGIGYCQSASLAAVVYTNNSCQNSGLLKFSDNSANRSKYYVCSQGCDLITVFDSETDLPMRCFEVGQSKDRIESPHQIRVSPDGKHYYIIFLNGTFFQKFRTSDDSFVAQAYIESGSWNTFILTKDSKYAFCVDYNANDGPNPGQGRVKYIDLNSMQVLATYVGSNLFAYPHAVALNKDENILYVFGQEASFFYKIYLSGAGSTPLFLYLHDRRSLWRCC